MLRLTCTPVSSAELIVVVVACTCCCVCPPAACCAVKVYNTIVLGTHEYACALSCMRMRDMSGPVQQVRQRTFFHYQWLHGTHAGPSWLPGLTHDLPCFRRSSQGKFPRCRVDRQRGALSRKPATRRPPHLALVTSYPVFEHVVHHRQKHRAPRQGYVRWKSDGHGLAL